MVEYSTGARAEVRARQKFLHQSILHKILHLPDTLNVFISLELIAVDDFEVGSFLVPKRNLRVGRKPLPLTEIQQNSWKFIKKMRFRG